MKAQENQKRKAFSSTRNGIYLGIVLVVFVTVGYIISDSHSRLLNENEEINTLEIRLAKALEPVPDPPPELEEWMLLFDDGALILH